MHVRFTVTLFALLSCQIAHAEDAPGSNPAAPPPSPAPPPAPTPPPAPAPPPYSVPWQLRPVMALSVIRSDTTVALFHDKDGQRGATLASMLTVSYKVTPNLAPFVRLGAVANWPPMGESEVSLVNPALGATYGLLFKRNFRLGLFFAMTLPFGQGGGNTPNPAVVAANKAGAFARSAMDNVMFAVNYLAVVPGISFAYVGHGFTAQVEATVFQLVRVRGDAVDTDKTRTNFTMGLHLGYFVVPQLSLGAELRYQTWLSTPSFVAADTTGSLRDNLSVAVGVRGHFRLNKNLVFRPGIAYARGLDKPMSTQDYNIVQVDLPLAF